MQPFVFRSLSSCMSEILMKRTENREFNCLRMNYRFEKITLFPVYGFQVVSHLWFERRMAYAVCHAPREYCEICYHGNHGITS